MKTVRTMMRRNSGFLCWASAVALTLGVGCQTTLGAGQKADSGIGSASGATTGAAGSSGTGAGAATSGGTSGTSTSGSSGDGGSPAPVVWDVHGLPDSPDIKQGCRAVDFLFVIDDSGSMYSYQQNLVNNFPTFIDGIQSTLTNVDSYHVGVVTTDAYFYDVAGCQNLGNMVVKTGGLDSSMAMCGPYAEGFNFMTEADDLATSFSCAAHVGDEGDGFERPMNAMEAVASRAYDGPGQCNEGFLRDEALLVVVIITDEYDGPNDPEGSGSTGDPMSWYQTVVDGKQGIEQNAAVLALVNYDGGNCPPPDDYSDGVNIVDFANMFGDNGFVGGICEPDYGPIFQDAVDVIDNACSHFIPPG